jgi:hypothetical protein
MASGRDFTRDAVESEQDALIGIQTCGGTILRGAMVPPSSNETAGREGTRRTPGTGRERSPPSPVRSGHQDWPALHGTEQDARGRLGAPESRQPEEDRNSPFRAAERAPPGFTALATGPTLNLRPEWLSNPRGTPQRTPGEDFGHGTQDARQMGAFRPGVRNALGEENNPALREKREPAPARLRFEEDKWGGSPKRQAPAKPEGLSDFPARPQLPQEPPAQMVKEQSSSEVTVKSHAGTGGGSARSALTSRDKHHAWRLLLTHKRAPSGTQGQRQRDPRSSRGRLDPRRRRGPRLSPQTTLSGHSILSTPFLPRLHLQGTGQLVKEGLIMQGTPSRMATPTRTREEENPQLDPRGIPRRTRLRHRQHGFNLRKGRMAISPRKSFNPSKQSSSGE